MRISDAYSVLSSPDKRAAYDRDVMRKQHHSAATATRGSYSSTGPAGGRAASGLSRRRSTYTGPPPSFYRNGGWGAHGTKRAAAHEASSGGAGGARAEEKAPGGGTWGAGMGYGQGQRAEDVPHFDHEGHERTHRRMDRRKASSTGFEPPVGSDDSFMGGFIVVSTVLAVALAVPALFFSAKRDRADRNEAIRQGRV